MKWADFPEHKTLENYDLKEQNALGEKQFNILKELNDYGHPNVPLMT